MITPPPVIKPKRKFPWVIVLVCLVVCGSVCFTPLMIFRGIFTTPPITENDYLQNVQETPVTLKQLGFTGSVIATRRDTLTLYTADEQTPLYTSPWRIYKLAGPNQKGHLVVFEINQRTDEYRFTLVDFNSGKTRVAYEGKGNVIWDTTVGDMAMHPLEDKVAYFVETGNRQYPGAYMSVGKLVELDLTTQAKTDLAKDVIESDFTYSADGKSLYFARSTSDSEPQITQKTFETGDLKPLGPGWDCSLTIDSTALIVYGRERSPSGYLDFNTGQVSAPEATKYYFWPISTLSKTLILAQSLPLTKEAAQYFPPTGSISGAHLKMRLGVFEPTKQRAAILRTDLDRWEPITFSGQKLSGKAFKTIAPDQVTE